MTSLSGPLGQRMENTLKGVHHNWKGVHISTSDYQTVLGDVPLDNLVYLTADSNHVIETLESDKVYIIGGLVDRNRYKVFWINGNANSRACAMTKPLSKE